MILWLGSYPRSGNTLARMVIHAGSGLPTYSTHKNGDWGSISGLIGHRALPKPPEELVARKELYIIKTHHNPDRVGESPVVYIVRDGRDALVSHAHYIRARTDEPYEDVLTSLIRGELKWELWSDGVLRWWARGGYHPTAYVRYEDLRETPYNCMQIALDRVGVSVALEPRPLRSFDALHNMDPTFFRKGKVGSWRQEMSPGLHKLFWEIHEGGMKAYGYTKN